ncbi:MAG: glycosyltransferase family 9 protein [Rhodospirillales bacterium]
MSRTGAAERAGAEKRLLFITATRVGDAVLSTGILRHLIERHPGIRVSVACGPAAAPLFEAVPGLEDLFVMEKKSGSMHWLDLWKACIGRRWDVLVDLRRSLMPFALRAGVRFRRGKRHTREHRVRQLAAVVSRDSDPPAPTLWAGEKHRAAAARFIPDGGPVLALGPTANWAAKVWPAENFAELMRRLTGPDGILPDARVAVLGAPGERPMAQAVLDAISTERRIDLVGRIDLLTAYACLKRCAFYVGNDSGLMHVAAAAGVPTLGLFGPSDDVFYAPWGSHCTAIRTQIPFESIFPPGFDHRTSGTLMDTLSVDAAEAAAHALWQRLAGKAA